MSTYQESRAHLKFETSSNSVVDDDVVKSRLEKFPMKSQEVRITNYLPSLV